MEVLILLLVAVAKEFLPDLIELIRKIFDRIGGMETLQERRAARKEVAAVVKQNLRKRKIRGQVEWTLRTSEDTVKQELEALLAKYEAKA